jgi:hypothetical protein
VVGYRVLEGSQKPYVFGVIGNDTTHLTEERDAGIEAKLFYLSWREFYPQEGVKDAAYIAAKKQELQRLREAGFKVIVNLGYQDNPLWVHQNYPDSYYVDQHGERYTATALFDNGQANLVFNRQIRGLVASYMKDVTTEFGTDFYAVRLGGGRYGELTYPPSDWNGKTNRYWAYDQNALASSPVPNWGPGNPSPNAEASRFLDWYLGALVEYQNWQISALRATGYDGRIMMLYPSWGLRPGQIENAVATDLDGSTSAERNGEVQRGYDFARQVAAIADPKVMVTTTWLDAPTAWSGPGNPTPVEYLSTLARQNPHNLQTYGENTGHGDRTEMEFTASQMRRYGLEGMLWYNEQELFSGQYATLSDYQSTIAAYR